MTENVDFTENRAFADKVSKCPGYFKTTPWTKSGVVNGIDVAEIPLYEELRINSQLTTLVNTIVNINNDLPIEDFDDAVLSDDDYLSTQDEYLSRYNYNTRTMYISTTNTSTNMGRIDYLRDSDTFNLHSTFEDCADYFIKNSYIIDTKIYEKKSNFKAKSLTNYLDSHQVNKTIDKEFISLHENNFNKITSYYEFISIKSKLDDQIRRRRIIMRYGHLLMTMPSLNQYLLSNFDAKVSKENFIKERRNGEKNPLNSWNLPPEFYDKEIKMPQDAYWLGLTHNDIQLGIN